MMSWNIWRRSNVSFQIFNSLSWKTMSLVNEKRNTFVQIFDEQFDQIEFDI